MGQPTWSNIQVPYSEHIGVEEGTRGTETSKYPEEEKVNNDSVSSGERKRRSLNQQTCLLGLWDSHDGKVFLVEPSGKMDHSR